MTVARPHWWPAYVGLGSNLDEPRAQVARAFDALAAMPRSILVLRSSLYRSAPLGPQDQPDFINAVAAVLTQLPAEDLLVELQRIERDHGRVRGERWGPRILDLDLLVYGRASINSDTLQVPHQRIAERNFVLLPLAEIAPELRVPGLATVTTLAARVAASEPRIERLTG